MWPGAPVLHACDEVADHLDRSLAALDASDEDVGAFQADVVTAGTGLEAERISDGDLTVGGAEHGSQHQRAAQVAALSLKVLGRTERPVAGVGIEQTAEHRRRVETRHAPPVDRTVPVDQRG